MSTPPKIRPNALKFLETNSDSLRLNFVAKRAATWKIDARGRLEWIDGMCDIIQHAKNYYHENIRRSKDTRFDP